MSTFEVRLYNQKHLIHSFKVDDVVTGMQFGTLGREELLHALQDLIAVGLRTAQLG